MKEQILEKISAVVQALDKNICVSGRQNMTTIVGSIAVLEDVMAMLQTADVKAVNAEKAAAITE